MYCFNGICVNLCSPGAPCVRHMHVCIRQHIMTTVSVAPSATHTSSCAVSMLTSHDAVNPYTHSAYTTLPEIRHRGRYHCWTPCRQAGDIGYPVCDWDVVCVGVCVCVCVWVREWMWGWVGMYQRKLNSSDIPSEFYAFFCSSSWLFILDDYYYYYYYYWFIYLIFSSFLALSHTP